MKPLPPKKPGTGPIPPSAKRPGPGGPRPGAGRKPIPPTPLPAALRDPERLSRVLRGREIPEDAEHDLYEVLGFASSQIAKIAAGEFSHRRAPTMLKAASALLDEALGKLIEKHQHSGAVSFIAAVADAARRIEATDITPELPAHVEVADG